MASRLIKNQVIIPRGFGGIRTTLKNRPRKGEMIIPRGFGGIRTTTQARLTLCDKIIPRGFGGIRTTTKYREKKFVQIERIWRYQDNWPILKVRLYREDLAVSGLYREDLAVSGQRIEIETNMMIIPRGFGGIRTTFLDLLRILIAERIWRYQDNQIIPRGFGGIRTTSSLGESKCQTIIPRGFGGIRTTRRWKSSSEITKIIPRGFGGIRTTDPIVCL